MARSVCAVAAFLILGHGPALAADADSTHAARDSILTLPAVKLLLPGVLFGPELRPAAAALAAAAGAAALFAVLAAAAWAGRIQWRAPREQQREAELNA